MDGKWMENGWKMDGTWMENDGNVACNMQLNKTLANMIKHVWFGHVETTIAKLQLTRETTCKHLQLGWSEPTTILDHTDTDHGCLMVGIGHWHARKTIST
jgi:hypothetical protein